MATKPSLRVSKPAYSEPVNKPGNMEGRASDVKYLWWVAGLTLALIYVAAADQLVVVQ